MKVDMYVKLPSDRQRDFRDYLQKRQVPRLLDTEQQARERLFIRNIVLPILEAEGEFNEYNMETALVSHWGMNVHGLLNKILRYWLEMTNHWRVRLGAKHLSKSPRTIRRWASTGKLFGQKDRLGQWNFSHEVIIDHEVD